MWKGDKGNRGALWQGAAEGRVGEKNVEVLFLQAAAECIFFREMLILWPAFARVLQKPGRTGDRGIRNLLLDGGPDGIGMVLLMHDEDAAWVLFQV